jgi:hypothetical protein
MVYEKSQHNKYKLLMKFSEVHKEEGEEGLTIEYDIPDNNIIKYDELICKIENKQLLKEEEHAQLMNNIE